MRVTIIGKSDIVSNENLIFQGHAFTKEGMTGDLASVSDLNPLLDLYKGSNLYVVPDLTTVKIDETVKLDIFAQFHVRSHRLKQML